MMTSAKWLWLLFRFNGSINLSRRSVHTAYTHYMEYHTSQAWTQRILRVFWGQKHTSSLVGLVRDVIGYVTIKGISDDR